jgi:hypothetical protein
MIFKSLISDWQMIPDTQASRDVFNVIELKALTQWLREQGMSQNTLEPIPPPRTVEERARRTYVKKPENLQHVLDHYASVAYPIKLGIGLRDGERWYDIWIKVPLAPASSIAKYETALVGYLVDRIEEMSRTWAVPILSATSQVYQLVMKCHDNEHEMWYTH